MDGKDILPLEESCIAHHLSLKTAVQEGIIRETQFQELTAFDLDELSLRQPEKYAPKVIPNIKRMVPILRKVKELLDEKRDLASTIDRDVPHMAIAITRDTYYAELLLELWQTLFPNKPAESYHSKNRDRKDEIMRKLKNNELSLVIIVEMLLEGFDHPPISTAAITYNIQSPVKFAQFIGRAQRIYRKNGYTDILCANIVTHADYEQRKNYDNYINESLIPLTDTEPVAEMEMD